MEQQKISPTVAGVFLAGLSSAANDAGMEDWMAGGSFGDIIKDLRREGHISDALYIAGCRLVHDMTRQHGHTGALVSRYGDQVDGAGSTGQLPSRFVADFDAFDRMNRVLGAMRSHERRLLEFLILSRELRQGGLSDYGRTVTNYKTPKTAKAAATGRIRALLETISELYAAAA